MVYFWFVYSVLVCVFQALELHIAQFFFRVSPSHIQSGNPVDHIDSQTEAIDLILNRKIERSIDVSFFFVSPHVQVLMIRTTICQAVNERGKPATSIRIPVALCDAEGVKTKTLSTKKKAWMQAPIEISRRAVEKCFYLTSSPIG